MKLYFIQSEKAERYVISNNAVNARSLALKSGIGGHKIDRRVFRTSEGQILEVDRPPGVITEAEAENLVKSLGYDLDGKEIPKEDSKTCLRCGEVKALSLFPPRSGGGYQSYCRECKKAIDREYRLKKKMSKEA